MEKEIIKLENEISNGILDILLKLKTFQKVTKEKIPSLDNSILSLLRIHKEYNKVDKNFLCNLYSLRLGIKSESDYVEIDDFLWDFCDRVDEYVRLLLTKEVPEDRQSGVPRVF